MERFITNTPDWQELLREAGKPGATVALFGLPPAGRAQAAALLGKALKRPVVVVTQGEAEATRFARDAAFFGAQAQVYPQRDLWFRPVEGQNRAAEYRRLQVLGSLVGGRCNMVCAPVSAVLQHTAPKAVFLAGTRTVKKGENITQNDLIEALLAAGYTRRPLVEGPGQFSVRGGIVDIYPPDTQTPVRLEMWGDTIDGMWSFDLITQRRDNPLRKLHISPSREVLLRGPQDALSMLEQAIDRASGVAKGALSAACAEDMALLRAGAMPVSMDKYLPLRYPAAGTLLDYLDDPLIFVDEPSAVRAAQEGENTLFTQEIKGLLEQGVLSPGLTTYYESYSFLMGRVAAGSAVLCENFARSMGETKLTAVVNLPAHVLPVWNGTMDALREDIDPLLAMSWRILVLTGTKRAAKALLRDLQGAGIRAEDDRGQEPLAGTVLVGVGALSGGISYPFARFALFTGRGKNVEEARQRKKKAPRGLTSLEDIKPGDLVVHYTYGIGLYAGIKRLDMQGVVKDYLKVQYAGKDVLYVPVTQLDLLSRYTSPGDDEKVKLSRLSGDAWQKTKNRVKKATEEMAGELIAIYANRQLTQGTAFPEDGDWQRDFESRFEYDETDDQLVAAAEIKKDMEKPAPMDRLLCGDVGVGKTEVALRAVFKCVMGGRQAAVLVPTTILAWQHYNTFQRRLEAFPVGVDMLSRFRTPAQQRRTLTQLRDGRCDVVVGTHRLLQKDIQFKNLGLLVVDEEQRFGVRHKEALKQAFPGVDVLTLSATPIPRTLNMAMSGIRDMSTIDEPPVDRQPVETYVLEQDDVVLAAAIRRELGRAGQVYYLHNRVDTIDRCAAAVAKLAPGARIGIAHGKMGEEELSAVWQRLLDGDIDILVCTTIIETGVDVPGVNTLIIEDADRMGLAQLYQIRGRVGRSGRKAYAYFTFRRDKVLTEIADKRLSAIREFTAFGSGLRIAMRDMQIRGVGNLLGKSQHGHMEAVGYDLYVKLLTQAVAELRGEAPPPDKANCLIDITVDAYIPTEYIPQASGRIEMYKAIAAIENEKNAQEVLAEMEDRYGPVPNSARGLIEISLLRPTAAKLGVYEITQKGDNLLLYSDRLDKKALRPALRDMAGLLSLNASAKPYLSVKVGPGQEPLEVLGRAIRLLEGGQREDSAVE